jgi:hypothetical protein
MKINLFVSVGDLYSSGRGDSFCNMYSCVFLEQVTCGFNHQSI